jgi:hypothetical protein
MVLGLLPLQASDTEFALALGARQFALRSRIGAAAVRLLHHAALDGRVALGDPSLSRDIGMGEIETRGRRDVAVAGTTKRASLPVVAVAFIRFMEPEVSTVHRP